MAFKAMQSMGAAACDIDDRHGGSARHGSVLFDRRDHGQGGPAPRSLSSSDFLVRAKPPTAASVLNA